MASTARSTGIWSLQEFTDAAELAVEPILQRLVGTGTIGFATAAAAGDVESTWIMIARPGETHARVVEAIHRAQSK